MNTIKIPVCERCKDHLIPLSGHPGVFYHYGNSSLYCAGTIRDAKLTYREVTR